MFVSPADSFHAPTVRDILFEVVRQSESVGISVDAVISDMGPGNQALWRLCGVSATKHGRPRVSCPHPCGSDRLLYFLADTPHLLKNLRGHFLRKQVLTLDNDTVKKHNLPTNEVSKSE